jgi:uncharacterized membrane protein
MEENKKEEGSIKAGPEKKESKNEDNDKMWAALAYILFFLPLLKSDRSEYVTFHTNQGTLFFIFAAGGNLILTSLPIIGWILLPFFFILVVIFFIKGLINAMGGKMKELPWFGHLRIIE